ncbi:cysteine rich repeat-containing protein [Bradyrhizobium sp. 18BD]
MFNTLKHASTRTALLAATLFATATGAFAQAPTEAQKSAIRSACRSDFIAHCSSVTPGGVEAYQCLQSHMSSLSSGCQTAVRAVEPASAPKTEAAPAKSEPAKSEAAKPEPAKTEAAPAAEPKPAAAAPKAAAAKQPSSAQIATVKSACRADYPKVCASVPPGGAPALECLEKNKARVSPACEKAVTAAAGGGGGGAAATAAPAAGAGPAAAAAPAAAPAVIVLRPLRPREELFIVRSACGADIRTLCAGVAPGGGRIVQCVASNAASLSPACKEVLAPFAAR